MPSCLMCELAKSDASVSDAFHRRQFLLREAAAQLTGCAPPPSSVLRMLRVLIIDADRDLTDSLARLIHRWGNSVQWAYDDKSGLEVAAAQQPDVVLLDIAMPNRDGFRMAQQLRQAARKKECFIIAVTEIVDDPRRRRNSEAGIDLFLDKPVDVFVLETLLLLESHRLGLINLGGSASDQQGQSALG